MTAVGTALAVAACGSAAAHPGTSEPRPSRSAQAAVSTKPDAMLSAEGFAERTCKANQALLAPGGTVVAVDSATVAGVLAPLGAMSADAARIASLPPQTRLAICVYKHTGASSTSSTRPAGDVPCPGGRMPVDLTPGGPLVAFTIAESGQRLAMPTQGPSFLSPCMTPQK